MSPFNFLRIEIRFASLFLSGNGTNFSGLVGRLGDTNLLVPCDWVNASEILVSDKFSMRFNRFSESPLFC